MRRNLERWRAIEARLGRELTIWIATVRRDGRPHMVPVWYVWLEEKMYIATGEHTQKYVNLRANQNVAVSLPDPDQAIILEGEAHACNRETTEVLADYFLNKYNWDFRYDKAANWRLIEITPRKILAWGDGYDHEGVRVM